MISKPFASRNKAAKIFVKSIYILNENWNQVYFLVL